MKKKDKKAKKAKKIKKMKDLKVKGVVEMGKLDEIHDGDRGASTGITFKISDGGRVADTGITSEISGGDLGASTGIKSEILDRGRGADMGKLDEILDRDRGVDTGIPFEMFCGRASEGDDLFDIFGAEDPKGIFNLDRVALREDTDGILNLDHVAMEDPDRNFNLDRVALRDDSDGFLNLEHEVMEDPYEILGLEHVVELAEGWGFLYVNSFGVMFLTELEVVEMYRLMMNSGNMGVVVSWLRSFYRQSKGSGYLAGQRRHFLQYFRSEEYIRFRMEQRLEEHLLETEERAWERYGELMGEAYSKAPVSYYTDTITWLGRMNAISHGSCEKVLRELVYV